MRASPKDIRDENSIRPASSEGSSQENAVVLEDSQPESDTNESCPPEGNIGSQIDDQLAISGISTLDRRSRECPTDTEDAINSEALDSAGTQAIELPRCGLTSTPPTSPSTMNIRQPTQETSGHTILKATTHQRQRPTQKVERQGTFPTLKNPSSSSGTDDDNYDSDNHTTWLVRKRKRSPPAGRHGQTSNPTSKRRPKNVAHSAYSGRPSSNCPSVLKRLSVAQYSGCHTEICYSDDCSDDSSEESCDRGRHLGNNKRPMLTARPYRSRRHKRKRNRSSADKDDEYEVEQILEARVNRGKLRYRVKWLGYEDDPEWYDASNFKNSPCKLRDFHIVNPTRPGPPKRLEEWVKCWEEDRDADDHLDDNKPERSHTRGRIL